MKGKDAIDEPLQNQRIEKGERATADKADATGSLQKNEWSYSGAKPTEFRWRNVPVRTLSFF
ncbi:MAG TPA: hypothetical protein VOA64_11595 [Candidatus Dormibacteraeota bacterium]|nr:hypothetical protein [Candidatus Dormibacteraeota bacterium]